jgi:hypothetical protein
LNKTEYGRHRGCSPKQVRRALALGWIKLEADGSINPTKADRSWAAAVDPAHPRGEATARPSSTYVAARLKSQLLNTDLQRERLSRERAQLVSADAASAVLRQLDDAARASWKRWPDQVAAAIARQLGIADTQLVRRVLARHVAEQLASIPPAKIDFRRSAVS